MALLDNIALFCNLAEASGAAAIDSVAANNLTSNNTVGTAAGIGGAGAARSFNGTNQYLSLASTAAVVTGDIDFSIQAWLYLTSLTSCNIVAKDIDSPANSRDYTLDYNAGAGACRFYVNGGGPGIAQSTVILSTGTWYHVTAGHDAAANNIWISVDLESPVLVSTSGTAPETSSAPFHIGSRAYSGFEGYVPGRIQYAGLWKRDIRSDRTALNNSGAGLSYTGMGGGGGGNRRRRLLICG
jgi:hypothetical protein